MNVLFGTHSFCRLQVRSLIHRVPPDCFRQPGFTSCRIAKNCLWRAVPISTHQPQAYPLSLVRTAIEITECISIQISEILLIIPMKQMKTSGTGELKAGQSEAVGVFKEIILPASTLEVMGLAG